MKKDNLVKCYQPGNSLLLYVDGSPLEDGGIAGDDSGPGTQDQPLATLAEARWRLTETGNSFFAQFPARDFKFNKNN